MIKNVMIDSVNYRIEKTDEVIMLDGQQCGAEVDYNVGLIRLGSQYSNEGTVARLLMHEIVHALLIERGMDEATDDEKLVDALAAGIVNLMRANPELVKLIINGAEQNGGI